MTVTIPRRRWILPHEAAVGCPGGRWGRRRTRVTECWSTLRAEDIYSALLEEKGSAVGPGALGTLTYTVEGRQFSASWEVRQNAVWRHGRVFLRCPRCSLPCTRLYLPVRDSWLACRRCWGLTYTSRTLQNYKSSLYGRGQYAKMLRTTQRDWAFLTTLQRQNERRERSRQRWGSRRQYLT
jgi:hypothetical protein